MMRFLLLVCAGTVVAHGLPALNDNAPVGSFSASDTILGTQVTATLIMQEGDTLSFRIFSPVDQQCLDEPFSYKSGTISLTNISNPNDCVVSTLASFGGKLDSLNYNATTNTINALVEDADTGDKATLILRHRCATTLTPSGFYHGTLSPLHEPIHASISTASLQATTTTSMTIELAGAVTVRCDVLAGRPASSDGIVALRKGQDCLELQFEANGARFDNIAFDVPSNTIEIRFTIADTQLTITLASSASYHSLTHVTPSTAMADTLRMYLPILRLQDPSGTYEGSKTILGIEFHATINLETATAMNFAITGGLKVECSSEAYEYANSAITFPNIDKSGDCLHDALANNNVKLDSLKYDSSADQLVLKVNYLGLSVTVNCPHV